MQCAGPLRCLCEVRGLARDPTTHCSCPCHDRPHVLFSNGPTCTVYSQGTVYSRGVTEAQRRWAPRTNLNSKATASLHKFEEVPAAASRRNNSRNAPKGTMRTAVEQGSPARGASNASCSASGRLRVASADSGGPSAGLPRKLFAPAPARPARALLCVGHGQARSPLTNIALHPTAACRRDAHASAAQETLYRARHRMRATPHTTQARRPRARHRREVCCRARRIGLQLLIGASQLTTPHPDG